MSRRSPGEGSIYPSSDGAGWIAALSVPASPGRPRRRLKRRARTKTEAKRLLRDLRTEVERAGSPSIDGRRKVEDAVANYLAVRQAQPLQPRTLEQNGWAAGLIASGLGHVRVSVLSVEDCDAFLAEAAGGAFGGPIARPQLRRLRQRLIRILENDQRRGLVPRNVAELTVIPEESPDLVGRRQPRAITSDEVARLIEKASDVLVVLIDLSARNGLRPAEARALRWSRLDLKARTLRVDAQMNRRNEIVKAKTSRSYRTIRLDGSSVERLVQWQEQQRKQQAAAGQAWCGNVDGLVATSLLGTALGQRNIHRSIVAICKRAAIEPAISAYDLRHTAITLHIERGIPPYKIADWAGTSERMIADVYRHKLDAVTDLGSIDMEVDE